ncbi:hypothetical protein MO867_20550 [Microbulbifer sp. OS29]|uniref:Uncharacterized protein n=1 Tax=Microbulbifer okhotskensis TaxID=2926617 RepID=A0A9X2J9K1_9GAMM|nr:hypothetical protein [Microbulbifer okhotskensis]MCO1336721.1 hypothetical protein [Microbulbifer okhotskensis]
MSGKNSFDYRKVRYQSLKKNTQRLGLLAGLNNLLIDKNIYRPRLSMPEICEIQLYIREKPGDSYGSLMND